MYDRIKVVMVPTKFSFKKIGTLGKTEIILKSVNIADPLAGPEMDNSEDREGYSLACGFGLGLVLLGMGNKTLPGLDDLKLTDRLQSPSDLPASDLPCHPI